MRQHLPPCLLQGRKPGRRRKHVVQPAGGRHEVGQTVAVFAVSKASKLITLTSLSLSFSLSPLSLSLALSLSERADRNG
jgi:hypothetical protein